MSTHATAKLFKHGHSQAVRLPKEFRLPGDRVRVSHVGNGVLLEPIVTDTATWFASLDKFSDEVFMPQGREQPPMPTVKIELD